MEYAAPAAAEPPIDRSTKPMTRRRAQFVDPSIEAMHEEEWKRFYAEMTRADGSGGGVPFRPGAVGLRNLGNTCYMNAVLQCLSHTSELRSILSPGSRSLIADINTRNPGSARSGGRLPSRMAGLFLCLWKATPPLSVLNPRAIRFAISQATGSFADSRQHDAQECLLMILDVLSEDLNRSAPRSGQRSPSPDRSRLPFPVQEQAAWERSLAFNDSHIEDLFASHEISMTTCGECRNSSFSFAPAKVLSLEIPPAAVRVEDCLEAYFGRERLDISASWHCEVCKHACPATKQLLFHRAPRYLLVHLKRFWGTREKITKDLAFPQRLDMSEYSLDPRQPCVYELYALVLHSGRLESGHYTAAAAVTGSDGVGRDWILFDDEATFHLPSFQHVLADGRRQKAYVLFYKRVSNPQPRL